MPLLPSTYLRELLQSQPSTPKVSLKDLLKKMEAMEAQARRCYSENIILSRNEFVEMMVLDACFIIKFLFQLDDGDDNISYVGLGDFQFIDMDLLLLENQIPFFIIEELFKLLSAKSDKPLCLIRLMYKYMNTMIDVENKETPPNIPEEIHHLFHLYYHWIIADSAELSEPERNSLFSCIWPANTSKGPEKYREDVIPCATVLHEAGVSFRKKISPRHILDITFKKGVMEIPPIPILDSNKPFFAKLVAFEQSVRYETLRVTSFTLLMDSLINTERDVAILQRCDVFDNTLGSEKEVAHLFNQLAVYVPIEKKHYFATVFKQVNLYRDNKWNKYRAGLGHVYFSNSWAILSLVAALILLVLTLWQTFFATYSYFRPP